MLCIRIDNTFRVGSLFVSFVIMVLGFSGTALSEEIIPQGNFVETGGQATFEANILKLVEQGEVSVIGGIYFLTAFSRTKNTKAVYDARHQLLLQLDHELDSKFDGNSIEFSKFIINTLYDVSYELSESFPQHPLTYLVLQNIGQNLSDRNVSLFIFKESCSHVNQFSGEVHILAETASCHFLVAHNEYELGNYRESLENLDIANKNESLFNGHDKALSNYVRQKEYAYNYRKLGMNKEAENSYLMALEANSGKVKKNANIALQEGFADLKMSVGNYDVALDYYNKLIKYSRRRDRLSFQYLTLLLKKSETLRRQGEFSKVKKVDLKVLDEMSRFVINDEGVVRANLEDLWLSFKQRRKSRYLHLEEERQSIESFYKRLPEYFNKNSLNENKLNQGSNNSR